MRVIAAFAAMLALAAAPPVFAENWRPPSGDFSLVIPEGWSNLGPSEDPGGLLRIAPAGASDVETLNECQVSLNERPAPDGMPQTYANGILADMDANAMVDGAPGVVSVRGFSNTVVDGVQVASVVTNQEGGEVYSITMFGVIGGAGTFRMYMLACAVSPGFTDADIQRFQQLVSSLRFPGAAE
jgi:hypothetical protein